MAYVLAWEPKKGWLLKSPDDLVPFSVLKAKTPFLYVHYDAMLISVQSFTVRVKAAMIRSF